MVKISIQLPRDLVNFVDSRVASGSYRSRSEAMQEAILAWRRAAKEACYMEAFTEIGPEWDAVIGDGMGTSEERW